MARQSITLQMHIDAGANVDPEALAETLDRLLGQALSTPGVLGRELLDLCGEEPAIGNLEVVPFNT